MLIRCFCLNFKANVLFIFIRSRSFFTNIKIVHSEPVIISMSSFYRICRPLFQSTASSSHEPIAKVSSWLAQHREALPTSFLTEFIDELCRRRGDSRPRGSVVKDLVSVGDVLTKRYSDLLAIDERGRTKKIEDGVFSIESAVTVLYGLAHLNIRHKRLVDALEPLLAASPCGFKLIDKMTPFLAVRVLNSLALLKITKCHLLSRRCLDVIETYDPDKALDKKMKKSLVWSQVAFCSAKLGLRPVDFCPWLPEKLIQFLKSPNVGKQLNACDITQLFVASTRLECFDVASACLPFSGRCLRGKPQDISMMCQAFSTLHCLRYDESLIKSMAVFLETSLRHYSKTNSANLRQFISLPAALLLLSDDRDLLLKLSVLEQLNSQLSSCTSIKPSLKDDLVIHVDDVAGGSAPSRLQDEVKHFLRADGLVEEISALVYTIDFVIPAST